MIENSILWRSPEELPAESTFIVILDEYEGLSKKFYTKWANFNMKTLKAKKWCYFNDLVDL